MNPRPESRIGSLEKRATTIEAAIEELAGDTAEELRAIRQDIKRLDNGMMSSFKELGGYFELTEKAIDGRFGEIKAVMVTKEDISRVETRFDKIEGRIDEQGKKLDQLLELVQKRLGE
jgi:uncharacterized coiled-coil protein SlyX